jgi:cytochrome c oxidase subunit IV
VGKGAVSEMVANHDPKTGFYVGVWIGLLCIAGLEVFLTYRGLSTHALLASLLLLAMIESAIGVLYFMHLKFERRVMMWSILLSIVFVLLMMNQIWPDAYRMTTIGLH